MGGSVHHEAAADGGLTLLASRGRIVATPSNCNTLRGQPAMQLPTEGQSEPEQPGCCDFSDLARCLTRVRVHPKPDATPLVTNLRGLFKIQPSEVK
jgi:hypothetical protein